MGYLSVKNLLVEINENPNSTDLNEKEGWIWLAHWTEEVAVVTHEA